MYYLSVCDASDLVSYNYVQLCITSLLSLGLPAQRRYSWFYCYVAMV